MRVGQPCKGVLTGDVFQDLPCATAMYLEALDKHGQTKLLCTFELHASMHIGCLSLYDMDI